MNIGNVDFKVLGTIGQGSFGKIFAVIKNGKEYALKVIEEHGNEGIKSLRELDIMSRINNPYLMNAEMVITEYLPVENISKVGILMEKADMDLNKAMHEKSFTMNDRFRVLQQITLGLKALHDSGYLHLDLKPLNILLFNNKKKARITDFGLSLLTENQNGERSKYYPVALQTVDHRSIGVLNGSRIYTAADDVWSLGIIFLEVLSGGKSLFQGFSSKDYTDERVKKIYEDFLSEKHIDTTLFNFIKDENAKKAIPYIKKMLNFDSTKRATLPEVLKMFKQEIVKTSYVNPIVEKTNCDLVAYEGYDMLFRMAVQLSIRVETFFLAADIYQRSLPFRNVSSDYGENVRNAIYNATLSLYMAIKMVESYFADTAELAKLAGNIFKPQKLILGESVLTNNWGGIIYPNNLFRASTTERRLLQAFELTRNCFLYSKIDLAKWREYSEQEQKDEGKFNKYTSFSKFVGKTQYYHDYLEKPNYLRSFYEKDSQI
jgi:serine/threonine protein kinase